ncbi:MAG: Uncharacterized protein CEO12_38 [Parcubacteria group bacterium Gr01-1014_46]|nr:MAG: Uncharacterized protein CEO12_38 [Parcubacteria group bacterium Gr01-1014_46]
MSDTILNKKFQEKYKALNKAQKEAVDAIDGPVMVVAGPGTGKTTILTLRIANILKETDTPPSGILALTFTDAGAKVMRLKLREIIGSSADLVRIHTFHGFASSVIAEFPDHFPHLSRSTQITEIEAEAIVREILKDKKFSKLRPFGDKDYYIGKILGAIRDCKKEAWTPDVVKSFAKEEIERVKTNEDSISTRGSSKGELKADALKRIEKCERTILFSDVYSEYEIKKREERKMDFDDLLFELLLALQKDELLLRLLQEKFLYILVDEHQDTNDSQNLIVTLLANFFENPNVFVVGDEKQAIYRFQGASVENFLKFQNIWKSMKVITLKSNYRSHQSILDATFSMIENNYADGEHLGLRTILKSESKTKQKPIEVVSAGNSQSADNYLVKKLKEIHKNAFESTVAVIVRKNREVEHILNICEAGGVPVSAERGTDVFSHPVGILYFNLLEYLDDPTKVECLAETLAVGLWKVSFTKGKDLISKLRSSNIEIEKEIPALNKLQQEITNSGVISFLILVGDLSGFTELTTKNPLSAEVWRSIIDLSRDIAERQKISDPKVLIKELLAYRKTAETKSIKIGGGKLDANIHIMTAHGSKGLEYDLVFLPFATEESWMRHTFGSSFVLPREKDEKDEIRDARRLFYVAMTRAREHVEIVVPLEDNLGKIFTPLRFISEMDKNHVKYIDTPAVHELPKSFKLSDIESQRRSDMIEHTKRTIVEKGLSVTALNHYMVCPRQFFYKSILKIPEAPSVSSEKGIAMHKALAYVWKEEDRSVKNISRVIEDTVKDYFHVSLLPSFEKEIIVEELLESAPKVATALHGYFQSEGKVFTEIWEERAFDTTFGKKQISFNLHGQLDAVIDLADKVGVFDYKTREALSVNAIKGETKDSDGNYFRQLVFYKILLGTNSKYKGKQIEPALIFVKPDSKGRCPTIVLPIEKEDEAKVMSEVEALVQSVWSEKFLEADCEDKDCKYCKMFKLIV